MVDSIPSIKVFISSPGDVKAERELILKIIDNLEYRPSLRGKLDVKPVAWDKLMAGTALKAKLKPQEAINRKLPLPSQCDIVLVVFWSRMGTPFTDDATGVEYLSGTHWELLNALNDAPHDRIVIYRRMSQPDSLKDAFSAKYAENVEQFKRLQDFFKSELFYKDGQIQRGVTEYETLDEFRTLVERDLEQFAVEILDEIAARQATVTAPPAPVSNKLYDILIVSSPSDKQLTDEFSAFLSSIGLRVTTLNSALQPAMMTRLVDQAEEVLFLLTPTAKTDERITRIITNKRQTGEDLPWFSALCAGDLQSSVPYGLAALPIVDLRDAPGERTSYAGMAELIRKLAKRLGRPIGFSAAQAEALPALPDSPAPLTATAQDASARQIYISYRSVDAATIRPVVLALQNFGYSTWFDERDIKGSDWRREIQTAIEQCQVMVAQVSQNTVPSSWAYEDLAYADIWEKPIVPLALDRTFHGSDAPYPLNHREILDWSASLDPLRHAQVMLRLKNIIQGFIQP
jgi:hypothetical protein